MNQLDQLLSDHHVKIASVSTVESIVELSDIEIYGSIDDMIKSSSKYVAVYFTDKVKKHVQIIELLKSKGFTDLTRVISLKKTSRIKVIIDKDEYAKTLMVLSNVLDKESYLAENRVEENSSANEDTVKSSVNTQSDNLHSRIREIFEKYKDSDIKRLFAVVQSRAREIYGGMTSSPRSKMRLKSVTDILSIYHIDKSEIEEASLIVANLILEDLGVSEFVKVDSIEDVEDFGRAIIFVKNI